jgi:hypothetical protein
MMRLLFSPLAAIGRLLKRAVKVGLLAAAVAAALVVLDAVFGPDDKDDDE